MHNTAGPLRRLPLCCGLCPGGAARSRAISIVYLAHIWCLSGVYLWSIWILSDVLRHVFRCLCDRMLLCVPLSALRIMICLSSLYVLCSLSSVGSSLLSLFAASVIVFSFSLCVAWFFPVVLLCASLFPVSCCFAYLRENVPTLERVRTEKKFEKI